MIERLDICLLKFWLIMKTLVLVKLLEILILSLGYMGWT